MKSLTVRLFDYSRSIQAFVEHSLLKSAPHDADRKTLRWWIASFLTVAGPLLVASLLLAIFCGGALWYSTPVWHDEMWYFNEMSVFESVGWDGGYTVSHETPARADWVHFGTHGPFAPALYGTLAGMTGLYPAVVPMINATLLVLGGIVWVACCRVPMRQAWTAALVAATFWPTIIYIPTSMQEVLHHAMAFVLAALAVLLVRRPDNRALLLLALLAVAAAAQVRVTWCWVAVPLLWIALRPQTRRQYAVMAAAGLAFVGALYLEAILLISPYPNFMRDVLAGISTKPLATCGIVVVHAIKNVLRYIVPAKASVVQIVFRYQTLMILGAAIYYLRQRHLAAKKSAAPTPTAAQGCGRPDLEPLAFGFTLLNLLCIGGFVIAMYDVFDWRDYRVIAPHLLLGLLVLIGCEARNWLKGYAIVGVILAAVVIPQFAKFHRPRFRVDESQVAAFGDQAAEVMEYQPGAVAWENTVLMDIDQLKWPQLMALPRGIGISTVNFWEEQAWPPKSKYVLMSRELAARLGIPPAMRKVARTELGDIYLNTARVASKPTRHDSASRAR